MAWTQKLQKTLPWISRNDNLLANLFNKKRSLNILCSSLIADI